MKALWVLLLGVFSFAELANSADAQSRVRSDPSSNSRSDDIDDDGDFYPAPVSPFRDTVRDEEGGSFLLLWVLLGLGAVGGVGWYGWDYLIDD